MRSSRSIRSGSWLVVGMFVFGLLLIAGLYVYWTLHVGPFRSLTSRLEQRYPGSAPRVEGGKLRMDLPGESVLRIVMHPPFDPAEESKSQDFARDVARFALAEQPTGRFDVVEVHLFDERETGELTQRMVRLSVEEIAADADNATSSGSRSHR